MNSLPPEPLANGPPANVGLPKLVLPPPAPPELAAFTLASASGLLFPWLRFLLASSICFCIKELTGGFTCDPGAALLDFGVVAFCSFSFSTLIWFSK